MTLDIKEGDILVIDSTEYPIRSAALWSLVKAHSATFNRWATVRASTKRSPDISSGKRGSPTTNISSLKCTPLTPVDPELRQRMGLETPHTLWQSTASDTDSFVVMVLEDLK